jgi:hypothetical protein
VLEGQRFTLKVAVDNLEFFEKLSRSTVKRRERRVVATASIFAVRRSMLIALRSPGESHGAPSMATAEVPIASNTDLDM